MSEHDVVGVGRGPQDRLRALVVKWRLVDSSDAMSRGYAEAANTMQSCANELADALAALDASREPAPFPLPWRYDSLTEIIFDADGSHVADLGQTDDNRQDAAARYIVALANGNRA